MFSNYWIVLFSIPTYLLTSKKLQSASSSLALCCRDICVRRWTTTAYYPQSKEQGRLYSSTNITCLWHYLADHQSSRDVYEHQLAFAFSTQGHHRTNKSPWTFVLSLRLPELWIGQAKLTQTSNQALGETSWKMRKLIKMSAAMLRTQHNTHKQKFQELYN